MEKQKRKIATPKQSQASSQKQTPKSVEKITLGHGVQNPTATQYLESRVFPFLRKALNLLLETIKQTGELEVFQQQMEAIFNAEFKQERERRRQYLKKKYGEEIEISESEESEEEVDNDNENDQTPEEKSVTIQKTEEVRSVSQSYDFEKQISEEEYELESEEDQESIKQPSPREAFDPILFLSRVLQKFNQEYKQGNKEIGKEYSWEGVAGMGYPSGKFKPPIDAL